MAPMATKTEEAKAMHVLTRKTRLRLEGLKVRLKKTIGNIKSIGMQPKAPSTAIISPKNGNIAANNVATTTDNDLEINLGTTFLIENSPTFGSANIVSNNSFVGCR